MSELQKNNQNRVSENPLDSGSYEKLLKHYQNQNTNLQKQNAYLTEELRQHKKREKEMKSRV